MPNCIVCNTPNASRQQGDGLFARFSCARCGLFALNQFAEIALERPFAEAPIRRSLMSHTLRRMQSPRSGTLHIITPDDLPNYWREGRLPSPLEQADNLVLWIGDHQPTPQVHAEATPRILAATIGLALSPDNNDFSGIQWMYAQLLPHGYFQMSQVPGREEIGFMLHLAGWEKYETLRKQRVESRTAFMALKFDQPSLERVVQGCVRPAVARTGFELRILTDQQGAGLIDNQIRAALLSARFVIAELTHGSYGAYWEAGFGEGRGIPVIYMCEKAAWEQSKSHFDTNHMATIVWDGDNLKKAEDGLVAMIRATLRAEAKQTDD